MTFDSDSLVKKREDKMRQVHENSPVLIAAGQETFRDLNPERSIVDALAAALTAALDSDRKRNVLKLVDSIYAVPSLANYMPELSKLMPSNAGIQLGARFEMKNFRTFSADMGGSLPQDFLNRAADRLAAGQSDGAIIVGGELLATLRSALREGITLTNWSSSEEQPPCMLDDRRDPSYDTERAHGVYAPINAYPIVETALRHKNGFSLEQHQQVMAGIISRFSAVAAENPFAWRQSYLTEFDILDTREGNRMITYPYTRAMNSILSVDMAAAVVVTTLGNARRMGISDQEVVYLRGGAEANDIWYFSERKNYHSSPALRLAAEYSLSMSEISIDEINYFDLYSCFPSAVQVAADELGLEINDPRGLTLTGGLTQFGGPGNNYTLHAIATLFEKVSKGDTGHTLITANGGFLTKHSVGIYSTEPPAKLWSRQHIPNLHAIIDSQPHPDLDFEPSGTGVVEGMALRFKDGHPSRGIMLGRLDSGKRFLALTREEQAILDSLIGKDVVGLEGTVTSGSKTNLFEF